MRGSTPLTGSAYFKKPSLLLTFPKTEICLHSCDPASLRFAKALPKNTHRNLPIFEIAFQANIYFLSIYDILHLDQCLFAILAFSWLSEMKWIDYQSIKVSLWFMVLWHLARMKKQFTLFLAFSFSLAE